jgi:hypothetical protein
MDFTDKAQQTVADAIQLAKDYANAQVHPAHIAFTLINEDGVPEPSVGAIPSAGGTPLFVSVISRVGGDPVSFILASRR